MQSLKDISVKFNSNFDAFVLENNPIYEDIEIKSRIIAELGHILSKEKLLQSSQRELTQIFDEIFADVIISVYFTGCALDKPAHAVLRRAFELGIAIVYLWDLPHAFWSWKSHDTDLNFNDMLDHVSKPGYRSFLVSVNSQFHEEQLFDYSEARKLYRTLSNTIHGKISTHESNLPNRFVYMSADCNANLGLIIKVQNILLEVFKNRFTDQYNSSTKIMPHAGKLK
jgi:hypothetical protein